MTKMEPLPPVHPGEVLREEYLVPLGITPHALAAALRLSRTHVERLVRGEISLPPDTALRLAGYFATSPEFWLGIQARFDKHAMKLPGALTQLLRESHWVRNATLVPLAPGPRGQINSTKLPRNSGRCAAPLQFATNIITATAMRVKCKARNTKEG